VAAKTFDEALALLFPGLGSKQAEPPPRPGAPPVQPQAQVPPGQRVTEPPLQGAPLDAESQRLLQQAVQLMAEYERLSGAGKHREAGEKFDQLKQTLDQLNRKRGGGQ
jgi:hypothetical protein